MGLYCDYDDGDFDFYILSTKHIQMPKLMRRKRCMSCGAIINAGDDVIEIEEGRTPRSDVECKIYGDSYVPLATKYLCEECSDIYDNLSQTGLCITLDGDLHDDLRAYWEMTGFDKTKYDSNYEAHNANGK